MFKLEAFLEFVFLGIVLLWCFGILFVEFLMLMDLFKTGRLL